MTSTSNIEGIGTITDIDTKSYYLVVDRQSFVVKDTALKYEILC